MVARGGSPLFTQAQLPLQFSLVTKIYFGSAKSLLILGIWILLVSSAGCGRIGMSLLSLSDDSLTDNDGTSNGGGGSTIDGGTHAPIADPLELGEIDRCLLKQCASAVDRCPDSAQQWAGICGCEVVDADSDNDGAPDCIDYCPNAPDRLEGGVCGCPAALADADDDGVENCNDACPNDAQKVTPGICGCGLSEVDTDGDGMPDCADACQDDAAKVVPGSCGCGVPETDTDKDGVPDCVDTCSGDAGDVNYQPDNTCGVGYCRTTNTPSSCVAGVETACQPGAKRSDTDATCDGIDDDCDGEIDEDYVVVTQCGSGYCVAGSIPSSCDDGIETACEPGVRRSATDTTCDGIDDDCDGQVDDDYVVNDSCGVGYCQDNNTPSSCVSGVETQCRAANPLSANDTTADGVDDDCDGQVDEDACVPRTDTFGAGSHPLAPPPVCTTMTVRLWGAGGSSGNDGGYWGSASPGNGGAGGFASGTYVATAGAYTVHVGRGGQGCTGAGTVTGNTTLNGGAGGGSGSNGSGGSGDVTGGAGAGNGGAGKLGGGGGGGGSGVPWAAGGAGGGGGAASALFLGTTRLIYGGGGGGGGGCGTTIATNGTAGGSGGAACSRAGANATGSGGGGGGACLAGPSGQTQSGNGITPYTTTGVSGVSLPSGTAAGGGAAQGQCVKGGDGYAIITYGP